MIVLRLAIVTALATAVVVLLVFEHWKQARLRSRTAYLQEQVQILTSENQSLLTQNVKNEAPRLLTAKESSELLKLRGEVGSLRQQLQEIENRRAEGTQTGVQAVAPTPPPVVAFGTELHDMGATTP